MGKRETKKPGKTKGYTPTVNSRTNPTDTMTPIWDFSDVDNDGKFSFSPKREDFDSKLIIDKIISLSKEKWIDLKQDSHDSQGKTKHHHLEYTGISKEGKIRIQAKKISEEDYDIIFSFRLNNLIRIIGLKRDRVFEVKWYDPNHEFYPSGK